MLSFNTNNQLFAPQNKRKLNIFWWSINLNFFDTPKVVKVGLNIVVLHILYVCFVKKLFFGGKYNVKLKTNFVHIWQPSGQLEHNPSLMTFDLSQLVSDVEVTSIIAMWFFVVFFHLTCSNFKYFPVCRNFMELKVPVVKEYEL